MTSNTYQKRNDPTSLVLFILVALGLFGNWHYAQQMPGVDYYVTWTVADATRKNSDFQIYDLEDQKRMKEQYRSQALSEGVTSRRAAFAELPRFHATASPFLYSTVKLLSTNEYESSLTIWNALSLLGFSAVFLMFCNLLGFSKTATLVIFAACLFWMNALSSDLRVANINNIQLGVLASAYFLLSRDSKGVSLFLAGVIIAMLAVLKINLAPISLLLLGAWLIQGHGRKFLIGLAGMAAGTIFALGVSSLFFGGVDIWFQWLNQLFQMSGDNLITAQGNFNLLKSAGTGIGTPGRIALVFVLCALILGFLWWGRKAAGQTHQLSHEARHELELIEYAQLIGMGCLVYLLVSPLVWLHYYLLAVPMLIVSFRPWSQAPAHGSLGIIVLRLLPALVLLAFIKGPHWMLFKGNYEAARTIAHGISIIILFALGLWQLRFQDGRIAVKKDAARMS